MILHAIKLTDSGVIIVEFFNDLQQEDTIYIHSTRLLSLLESISNHDGIVVQNSKIKSIGAEKVQK